MPLHARAKCRLVGAAGSFGRVRTATVLPAEGLTHIAAWLKGLE